MSSAPRWGWEGVFTHFGWLDAWVIAGGSWVGLVRSYLFQHRLRHRHRRCTPTPQQQTSPHPSPPNRTIQPHPHPPPPPKALLYNARDGLLQRSIAGGKSKAEVAAIAREGYPEDTPENRRLGWQRMCLLVLYFSPSGAAVRVCVGVYVRVLGVGRGEGIRCFGGSFLQPAGRVCGCLAASCECCVPSLNTTSHHAFYPPISLLPPPDLLTPQESFAAISNRLLVGPVVQTLVYSKVPRSVCNWVDAICDDWRFDKVIPCHMEAPVK